MSGEFWSWDGLTAGAVVAGLFAGAIGAIASKIIATPSTRRMMVVGIAIGVVTAGLWVLGSLALERFSGPDGQPEVDLPQATSDPPGTEREHSSPSSQSLNHAASDVLPAMSDSVKLEVVNFCFCQGPRNQLQIKLKPRITNLSDRQLGLNATNLRLVVAAPLTGPWTPPRPAGDIIEVTGLQNSDLLAIPPNPDRAAERTSGGWTFATHWIDGELAPGETALDSRVKQGDLVFYVPYSESSPPLIYGLGYVETPLDGQVLGALLTLDLWKGESDPNNF